MRDLSPAEVIALGERFNIEIDDRRADHVTKQVNQLLADLNALDDIAIFEGPDRLGTSSTAGRSWSEPTSDEYNAVSINCSVPPFEGQGSDGELQGYDIGVKDVIAVAGIPMRCGSSVMRGFVPSMDAAVIERILSAGGTITAKTNLDEFAGSARGTTGYGPAIANPHDPDHTAGGSSGGSAVAVSTGRVDVALGTDTGGSVRIPASFCGVIGLKPTYGLVPLSGVVENTYTQDHVSLFASNLVDIARLLQVTAGADERDPASLQAAGRETYCVGGYLDAVQNHPSISDVTVGLIEESVGADVSERVQDRTNEALDRITEAGGEVIRISVGNYKFARPIKNALSFVELATHWRDGAATYRRGGVVDENYQVGFARQTAAASGELNAFYMSKLLAGARIVEAHDGRHYTRAQAARELIGKELDELLELVDVFVLPTLPDIAPRIEDADDWDYDYAYNTRIANVTRHPAITIPNGTAAGLPVGLQLIGAAFDEPSLLGISASIQEVINA